MPYAFHIKTIGLLCLGMRMRVGTGGYSWWSKLLLSPTELEAIANIERKAQKTLKLFGVAHLFGLNVEKSRMVLLGPENQQALYNEFMDDGPFYRLILVAHNPVKGGNPKLANVLLSLASAMATRGPCEISIDESKTILRYEFRGDLEKRAESFLWELERALAILVSPQKQGPKPVL